MVLILLWKMVKFMGRSALVIALKVAITLPKFLWRTAHPTISTNFIRRPSVRCATVAQTEYAERSFHSNRFHNRCILGPWRRDVEYFGRFLRWCRLVNAIIKKKLYAMIIRTHDKEKNLFRKIDVSFSLYALSKSRLIKFSMRSNSKILYNLWQYLPLLLLIFIPISEHYIFF